ncbi:diguanylate cyclase domain-containing protein [Janthinobacterium psychrotolerans]|uniref:PAS domain S-box-containing protein/diguanylate cyclase (GGDEF) domain-containing protein n=1 Tax=Janthinobacterium psychrotolerans TaxID=1747903 RepID=A0A1A7C0H2_9BURK|nr:diguanylate cyclase [Janthinobacterium psychrotolerans]OBV38499.1 PAS domain S-box-containing protein/diguanylate cyclase (GGDEF) domain-containing protein [Janthinobacterium psychrotolerans]
MRTRLRKSISTSLPASLKARMSVVVFLLVLGAVALLALATLAVAERDMRGVTSQQQYASLASAAVFIDEEMAARRNVLRVMADSIAAQDVAGRAGLQRFLAAQTVLGKEFFTAGVIDVDGSVLASIGSVRPPPGASVRERAYFTQTLALKRSVISEPLQGNISGMPLVVVTEPVFDARGQVRLVLAASVNLRQPDFLGRLDTLKPGPGGHLYVMTEQGIVIEHPDKSLIMQHIGALCPPSVPTRSAMQGFQGSMAGKTSNGDEALFAYRRLASTGWILASVYPTRDAFAPLRAIRSKILLAALVLAALAGLAGWRVVLRLLQPLERLRSQVHQIRRHRLGIDALQIERRDEIGDLSRDFYTLVAERELAETQTRDSERRLKLLTDHVPVVIVYIDREHRYQFINATFEKWFGVSAREGMMRSISEVLGEAAYQMREQYLRRAFAGEEVEYEFTFDDHGSGIGGNGRAFQTSYVPDVDDHGVVIGVYGLIHEITKVKAAHSALQFAAATDTLTGIANRRRFDEHMAQCLARTQATGAPMALAYLDIDRFKAINDSLGHQAGDEVLKEFAQRLQQCVRASDLVARLAGDEFVIVFEGVKNAAELRQIGAKIVAAIRAPFVLASGPLSATTSIGIAISGAAALTPEQLLDLADQALYQAKDAGRDGVALVGGEA